MYIFFKDGNTCFSDYFVEIECFFTFWDIPDYVGRKKVVYKANVWPLINADDAGGRSGGVHQRFACTGR